MGWFWADKSSLILTSGLCPVAHVKKPSESICPVDHSKFKSSNSGDNACPVKYDGEEVLNPLNNMPMSISSERAPGQKVVLSTEKTVSTIPRGDLEDQGLWVYPSPQQMYNAMLRKGKSGGISEDSVESMVEVHNFLNEGAWQQILQWESEYTKNTKVEPRLLKFMGRPGDLSPRAQMYLWLGKLFPATFNTQPPFDRHDWTILRSLGRNKGWKEVRYVIDYYSAQDDEETGMPAFMLDTRPALDSSSSAYDRFQHWSQPLWKKAMGKFDEL